MRLLGIGCPDSYRALRPERNGAGDPSTLTAMEPKLLWRPSAERVERATITRFARAVGREGDYDALWRWSVDDLEGFWAAIWEFFDVQASEPYERVLGRARDARRGVVPGRAAELRRARLPRAATTTRWRSATPPSCASWRSGPGASCASRPRASPPACGALGVGPGDRVAAYLPNIPETIAAFLATASIGAVWSCAAPEFGARSVVDRFAQIEPKVLLAVDGYRYGGRDFDRGEVVAGIADGDRRAGRALRLPRRQRLAGGLRRPDDEPLDASSRCRSTTRCGCSTQLRHDGPAQADRPRPGRDPARAPQEDAPAPRRAGRRPRLLVHDDRLDDVELPRRRAADAGVDRPLRRQPGLARTSACCGTSPRRPA